MNSTPVTYLAWATFVILIFVTAGVVYLGWAVSSEESAQAERHVALEQMLQQQTSTIRLHSVARETKGAREKLENIMRTDVVEILDTIEAVARDTKIPIEIGQAVSSPSADPASLVHGATFVIQAEGSFSGVMHAAALLESLPIPSLISDLQFERLPPQSVGGGKGRRGSWRVVLRMRFLTTADVSS